MTALENARVCVELGRLPIPQGFREVAAALTKARTCMKARGIRATGGPDFGSEQSPNAPDGELVISSLGAQAFIGFFSDARKAQRREPRLIQNAARFGGQVTRRGAVVIIWVRSPTAQLRSTVQGCTFG